MTKEELAEMFEPELKAAISKLAFGKLLGLMGGDSSMAEQNFKNDMAMIKFKMLMQTLFDPLAPPPPT